MSSVPSAPAQTSATGRATPWWVLGALAGFAVAGAAAGGFTFKGQSDDDDLTVELDEEDGQDEDESYSGEDYE